ncbi:MAG: DUF692 domain-containing protein [Acidobacteria bacterium]|nr:DUF692 domain-containing protein [Acidobacteriota bacterium]MCK6681948.1 DUF692 domain-containing protein [Thermoanaerobaculia bacterium]
MTNRWGLPHLGYGVGLRTVHYAEILSRWPAVDFFEAITENFLDTGGRPLHILDRVAERYPVVLHGVSLSIGSTDPLDLDYLAKVNRLARRVKARWVTDHLCWTGVAGKNVHDLLPLPYTEDALAHVARRLRTVMDFLERPVFLENPSTYLQFTQSTMTEPEFLSELCERAGTGLLLDVNNVYVSAVNHGFDPVSYIDALPRGRVVQYHLAGHTDKGTHLLDTHSTRPRDEVWDLYAHAVERLGEAATLYEWDEDIPDFATVHAEALKARGLAAGIHREEVAVA